ncbi:Golgi-associated PDZ and coiled-coil motif-containing protein-like isoform X2 [Homalodisca vitripennis]|uniref:Golgi-associated PDZ and coiled-coil motif-containing protein-like isoform X2 n=1 Tax=Homalodisca vitripennis TaxID=197043 RepID=UPI001EEA1C07|nr:Golgi-associated PDZ and coiled-coil motif-containing protein-like isoform X2 [Homalodisca vitripennis]
MAVTAESFRWLDILEKEFDKAFVDLDLLIGDLDSDEPEMVYNARQKMATLSSCFAQLTHKAQTIFQNNAKNEAELVNMRAELVDTKTRNQCLEEELHTVLVQLHTAQLKQLQGDDGLTIKNKLQQGLIQRSPTHKATLSGIKLDALVMSLENWKCRLELENESLRHSLVSLQAEVCGARLAARYLDKELAGRIQQLQLLGRSDMTGDARDRLWSQLEAEILVQRHKTVMRAVRQRDHRSPPPPTSTGSVRTVQLLRRPDHGLGISITASHQEAVNLLSNQSGNVTLRVQYLSNGGEDSEEDNDLSNLRYRFFEDPPEGTFYRLNGFAENNKRGGGMLVTPTAPRTPDSSVRGESECSYPSSPTGGHPTTTDSKQFSSPLTPPTTTESTNATPSQTESPRNFGVTTLQKIFRSLTPSGVWLEGIEDKIINVNEKTDNGSVDVDSKVISDLKVHPVEAIPPESPKLTDSPRIHMSTKGRETSQLFHPETEAMTLIDGLGDASFGTPV